MSLWYQYPFLPKNSPNIPTSNMGHTLKQPWIFLANSRSRLCVVVDNNVSLGVIMNFAINSLIGLAPTTSWKGVCLLPIPALYNTKTRTEVRDVVIRQRGSSFRAALWCRSRSTCRLERHEEARHAWFFKHFSCHWPCRQTSACKWG